MRNLVKNVQNINARYQLWSRGNVIILGISGGPDSMCLLDIFSKIALKEDLKIVVAHVNYGLRDSSAADQKFVEEAAREHGMTCEVYRVSQASMQNENSWRKERYAYFDSIAKKYDAHRIAVGHTMNDQAETLLLRLLRGAGRQGLRAMQIKRDTLIRPLLFTQRKDILVYLRDRGILSCEDETNMDKRFMRNNIRLNLLPLLAKEYNPKIIESLAQTAHVISDEFEGLKNNSVCFWVYEGEKVTFNLLTFRSLAAWEQRLGLRLIVEDLFPEQKQESFLFIEEIRHMLKSTKNKNKNIQTADLIISLKGAKVEVIRKNVMNTSITS